jgi:hypothetical protein
LPGLVFFKNFLHKIPWLELLFTVPTSMNRSSENEFLRPGAPEHAGRPIKVKAV